MPPSTLSDWPVMLRAASETRKTTALPMSSGVSNLNTLPRYSGAAWSEPSMAYFMRENSEVGSIVIAVLCERRYSNID